MSCPAANIEVDIAVTIPQAISIFVLFFTVVTSFLIKGITKSTISQEFRQKFIISSQKNHQKSFQKPRCYEKRKQREKEERRKRKKRTKRKNKEERRNREIKEKSKGECQHSPQPPPPRGVPPHPCG
jgi:hypothetical protein